MAKVNGAVLTCAEGNALLMEFPRGSTTLSRIVSSWIERELLYQSGVKNDFDKDIKILSAVNEFQRKQIGDAFLSSASAHRFNVTKENVREAYRSNIKNYIRTTPEAKILHVRLDSKQEATQIKKILGEKNAGEKRKELFTQHDVDILTVKKGALLTEVDKAVFNSKRNISGPIKTQHGYHVVEVLDRFKKGSQIGLEQVYDEIYQQLVNQQLSKARVAILDSLRSEALITINTEKLQ